VFRNVFVDTLPCSFVGCLSRCSKEAKDESELGSGK
jgi:hypothetical protein